MKPTVIIVVAFVLLVPSAFSGVVLGQSDEWPMWKHDSARTSYTTSEIPRDNNLLWKFIVGNSIVSSPAVVDGKVFFGSFTTWMGSSDKSFFSLSAENGQLIWAENLGLIHFSSPAVASEKVFLSSPAIEAARTYALNIENGDTVWTREIAADSSSAVVGGRVYVGSSDGKVYALNAENGDVLWNREIDGRPKSPAVVESKLYVGSSGGKVYALNAENGDVIWSRETDGRASSPAVVGERVYVGSSGGKVYALNAENGDVIWSRGTEYSVRSPSVMGNKIFVTIGDLETKGKILCLNTENGTPVWSRESAVIYRGAAAGSSPAIVNNGVIVGLGDEVMVLDPDNGELIWSYKVDYLIESSPAVANGRVYIGTLAYGSLGGSFYAFGTPPPIIEQPGGAQDLFGIVELSGIAEGDAVQATELNWGDGWVEAGLTSKQEQEFPTTRYINYWSYRWDTTEVPNGTYILRVRTRYNNDAYSDESTITLRVNNVPWELGWIVWMALIVVLAFAAFYLAKRVRRRS